MSVLREENSIGIFVLAWNVFILDVASRSLFLILFNFKVQIIQVLHSFLTLCLFSCWDLCYFLNLQMVNKSPLLQYILWSITKEVVQDDIFELKTLAFVNCQAERVL